jgi:thiol-disulfide isomerase/thioredoxin
MYPSPTPTYGNMFQPTFTPTPYPGNMFQPTFAPTPYPTGNMFEPTFSPTPYPTGNMFDPTTGNIFQPTFAPTPYPTNGNMFEPTTGNIFQPTFAPTPYPTNGNMFEPTFAPTPYPTNGNVLPTNTPTPSVREHVFVPTLDPKKSIQGITGNLVYSDIVFNKDGKNPRIDNQSLTQGKAGVLFIHASWCPHCTRFSPTYKAVCNKLNANGLKFPCLAIESSELTKNLSEALDFSGFPTIKFFDNNGNILSGEYEGERTENGLLSAILSIMRDNSRDNMVPTITPSSSYEEEPIGDLTRIDGITANLTDADFIVNQSGQPFIRSSYTKGKPGLLFIHASWCPHCTRFIPTYKSLCNKLNSGRLKFPCLAIESEQLKNNIGLAKTLQIRGFPTLKFFDQNGKILGNYEGNRDENSLLNAVKEICKECSRGLNF